MTGVQTCALPICRIAVASLVALAASARADMFPNGANAARPDAINNIVGGSSIGLAYGVLQTPSLLPGTTQGNVLAYGTGALRSRTPNDPACASGEYCAHITAIGYDSGAALTTTLQSASTATRPW